MTNHDHNSAGKLGFKKARENRSPFLIIDIEICDKLPPYDLKVYTQLRKLVDFREQHDEVQITIERLAIQSGISERKTYQVLNSLENEHCLIKRINSHPSRRSNQNSYDVAQTYGFFLDKKLSTESAPNADQSARHADYSAPNADQSAPGAVPYMNQQSFQQSIQHVCGEAVASTQHTSYTLLNKRTEVEANALGCEEVKVLFESRFKNRKVTLQQLFDDCRNHYEQKGTWVTKKKFIMWVERENPDNYQKDTVQTLHNSKMERDKHDYRLYLSQFYNDRDFLKIASVQGKEPLPFHEWLQCNLQCVNQ